MITLYSRPGCIPCDALKALLQDHGISFNEIHPIDLSKAEQDQVFAEILKVSTITTPTVPAVRIDHGNHSHWLSNSGKEDVSKMFEKLQKLLQL